LIKIAIVLGLACIYYLGKLLNLIRLMRRRSKNFELTFDSNKIEINFITIAK